MNYSIIIKDMDILNPSSQYRKQYGQFHPFSDNSSVDLFVSVNILCKAIQLADKEGFVSSMKNLLFGKIS